VTNHNKSFRRNYFSWDSFSQRCRGKSLCGSSEFMSSMYWERIDTVLKLQHVTLVMEGCLVAMDTEDSRGAQNKLFCCFNFCCFHPGSE